MAIRPPGTAEQIHRLWPNSNLVMVSKAGHAMSETGITAALVKRLSSLRTSSTYFLIKLSNKEYVLLLGF